MQEIADGIRRCTRCRLSRRRYCAVPGEGPPSARVMVVGEAPGEQEDLTGRPFMGRAGKYFDKLLAACGLSRGELFITSSVKCRPPGNRNPQPDELEICKRNWLIPQIDLIDPQIIVTLGKVAAWQVVGEAAPLTEMHGRVVCVDGRRCLATYHPASGMRFYGPRAAMEEDFAKLRRMLDEECPPAGGGS